MWPLRRFRQKDKRRGGGLVRQEIPRSARLWAEQSGNSAVLESGQTLIASEVVHIEFRYFDGTQVLDVWDMVEKNCLPVAIEISLWIAPLDAAETPVAGQYDATGLANNAREYRQTVYLPDVAAVQLRRARDGWCGRRRRSRGLDQEPARRPVLQVPADRVVAARNQGFEPTCGRRL